MVEGCRELAKLHSLYFITITCRGKEISHEFAEEHYLEWTNRFLDACRARSKRQGGQWHYVQVTERQKRGHPHSHILTTFCPDDDKPKPGKAWTPVSATAGEIFNKSSLRTNWLQGQVVRAGLGNQYDASIVKTAEGAARYVAKYLFKSSIFTADWPKGWKRIRYSQSFPKSPERESEAIVLISREDWVELSYRAVVVNCPDLDVYETCQTKLCGSDVILKLKTK